MKVLIVGDGSKNISTVIVKYLLSEKKDEGDCNESKNTVNSLDPPKPKFLQSPKSS